MRSGILITLLATGLLTACGQKGPLYLPENGTGTQQEQTTGDGSERAAEERNAAGTDPLGQRGEHSTDSHNDGSLLSH